MLDQMMSAALARRGLMVLLFVGIAGWGVWSLLHLPVDAFPDTSNVQVQVNTTAPALSSEEIEQQITLPVETALGGLPGLTHIRSTSKFGLSQVVAVFSDETGVYAARQFVNERLASVAIPEGIDAPQLGPVSSGLGEVFAYVLRAGEVPRTLEEIRTLHDWLIKPQLLKVPGVAEVNTWGGFEKQYQVVADPEKMRQYSVTLPEIREVLERGNRNVGGGQVITAGESMLVHGVGRLADEAAIAALPLRTVEGIPIRVGDVATVQIGSEIRRGAVTAQGKGEAVLGLGYMLLGANSRDVAQALRTQLELARAALPEDIVVEVVYDRTELVEHVLGTVQENLTGGAILVVVVLFFLMGSLRAALLVAVTIPLALLFAVLGMEQFAIAASLLSLGAIDFGILVDGSVVMTDANLRALRERQHELGRALTPAERVAAIASSAREVARPILFGMGIILIVFLPIFSLQGVEGKMFRPMAATFVFALLGSLAMALFLSPALSYFGLARLRRTDEGRFFGPFMRGYGRMLAGLLHLRGVILAAVLVLGAITLRIAMGLGGEFVPRLSEGAFAINIVRLPGIALETSTELNTRIEQRLLESFPDEIDRLWSRVGTAEVATDPMGIELSDLFITLKPRDQWTRATDQAGLTALIEAQLAEYPGQNVSFSQPIELRMNELTAGVRADIAATIVGDDFATLQTLAQSVQTVMAGLPGAADVAVDPLAGLPTLRITLKEEVLARLGIPRDEVLTYVEALGHLDCGEFMEGQRRFPLTLRLPDALQQDRELLARSIVPNSAGVQVTLGDVANLDLVEGIATINREWGRRVLRVQSNVRGADPLGFVRAAQERIAAEVKIPEGYLIEWGGQFEHLERSQQRFNLVVPITLALVFVLLYVSLTRLRDVFIVYTGIPFAAIGGILGLYARGIPFSVSAAIGFIALCGIAVLDGQVMIAAIRSAMDAGQGLAQAVVEGAKQRLRPVLATSITDALGFLPMAMSTGVGAEVQRPLATVVICGVISCTVLTLFVLPLLYYVVWARTERKGNS
jgi:cobalt-zinc-cadmium resistance protein CzcA